jgi:DHA1 family bicyclomycin/chloramphenicol resistance-like MFS transporter
VLLAVLAAFPPLSVDMYLPSFPTIARELGTSASAVQLTLTSFLIGLGVAQFVIGPVSDAVGRKRPLIAGLALYVVASVACMFAPTVEVLVATRMAQGAGGAAAIVICQAIVRDLYQGVAAARFLSRLVTVQVLGPIVAPLLGAFILRFTSWRFVFAMLAGIALTVCLIIPSRLSETLPPHARRAGGIRNATGSIVELLHDRRFTCYAVLNLGSIAAIMAYLAGSSFVLQDIYGLSPTGFAIVFAINVVGILVLSHVNAALVGRVGPRRLLGIARVASLGGAVVLLAAVLGGFGLWGVLCGFFLAIAPNGMTTPNVLPLALADHPQAAGAGAAIIVGGGYLVGAAVAPLGGIAGQGSALPLALTFAVAQLVSLTAYLAVSRIRGPADAPSPS